MSLIFVFATACLSCLSVFAISEIWRSIDGVVAAADKTAKLDTLGDDVSWICADCQFV